MSGGTIVETPKVTLPEDVAELLTLALADLKRAERSKFKINMSRYFLLEKNEKGKLICSVCLAGAVMVKTLRPKYKPDLLDHLNSNDFGSENRAKLSTISQISLGCHIYDKYYNFLFDPSAHNFEHYHVNKAKFKRYIQEAINFFTLHPTNYKELR